jgi:hypothetical protein
MNIQWDLLRPTDVGAMFNEGVQRGRATRIQGTQDSALAALARDPSNQSALAGLTSVNPVLGAQMDEMTRQRRVRSGLADAYDPTTGRIDPAMARNAYVSGGDIEGAMGFDAQQAKLREQLSEAHQEQFKLGAALLKDVKDEAGYQQARAAAQRMGMDLSEIPEAYDPNYVDQVLRIGAALSKPSGTTPNIQKEVDYYRGIGRNDLAEQLLERHAEGPPLLVRNPDDNTIEVYSGAAARPSRSVPQGEASLRAQAEEAIRAGADPAAVNARLEEMLRGGAGQSGPATFP